MPRDPKQLSRYQVGDLIDALAQRGIRIRLSNGRALIRGAAKASREDLATLRANKAMVLEVLSMRSEYEERQSSPWLDDLGEFGQRLAKRTDDDALMVKRLALARFIERKGN